MPGLTETTSGCRVMLLPNSIVQEEPNDEDDRLKVIDLKHPKTGEAAKYLFNKQTNKIYEIMAFKEDNRCWFIGERVVEDGSLLLSTPIDPTFLILPYLISAERNVPLDDLLDDPAFEHNIYLSGLNHGLKNVSNQMGDQDLNVWKYDEVKCLSWLEARVEAVRKVVISQQIDLSAGASSLIYKPGSENESNMVEFTRYSLGIVSEYLTKDLADKLKAKLNLPEPEKSSVKRQSEGGGEPLSKKPKQIKQDPTDDYTKGMKKERGKETEKNAKQKALAKSAEGSKSILSFFKKA